MLELKHDSTIRKGKYTMRGHREQQSNLERWIEKRNLLMIFLVVGVATTIFAIRYIDAFTYPNFYAEDATIIYENIFSRNPLFVLTTAFNGYLIVGQYIVGYIAVLLNFLVGNNFVNLPLTTSIASVLFLGITVSLPFILFRKELGVWLSLLLVLLGSLVPLYSYDYAIIGTLGNLKFSFLYIAFLFIVFRIRHAHNLTFRKMLLVDSILLLCVLTNVTAAFIIPFAAIPYLRDYAKALKYRTTKQLSPALISISLLIIVSALYILTALMKGIPKISGYLDGPFQKSAILPIIDRSTSYAIDYPITSTFNNIFVAAMSITFVAVCIWIIVKNKEDRIVVMTAIATIALGTGLFILNRPGIGDYYLNYLHKGGPDQFFYAQNLVTIFTVGWVVKGFVKRLKPKQLLAASGVVVLYLLLALPHGSSYGGSRAVYQYLMPIKPNLEKACREYASKDDVIIQIYPSITWQWSVDKDLACAR